MKRLVYILLPLVFFAWQTQAAVQVEASIDDEVLTIEDQTTITIEVSGGNVEDVQVPSVTGLEIMFGSQSSNMIDVNGHTSISQIFMYRVIPTDVGEFRIDPFLLTVDRKSYKTNSLKLTVTKSAQSNPPITTLPGQIWQFPQQQPQAQPQPKPQPQGTQQGARVSDYFWITTSVNKKDVLMGEQVLLTFKYYARAHPLAAELKTFDFTEFLSEVVKPNTNGVETINGEQVETIEKVIALFPTKEGVLTIKPAELELAYEVADRSMGQNGLDVFPFSRRVTKTALLKSEPITIKVSPLPQPIPKNFTNLVGKFGMEIKTGTKEVKAGESLTLEVSFAGAGNIRNALLPDLNLSDVKVYPDKPELETYQSSQGISGKKTFKVVLVPQQAGSINTAELKFVYFDLDQKAFLPLSSDPLVISVLPGDKSNDQVNAVIAQDPVKQAAQEIKYQDLAPLATDAGLLLTPEGVVISHSWFLVIFLGLPLLPVFLVLAGRFRMLTAGNSHRFRRRNAYRVLSQTLSRRGAGADDVLDAVQVFMSHVFGVTGGALTAGEMKDHCESHGVIPSVADALEKIIQELEAARYGFDKQTTVEQASKELLVVLKKIDRDAHSSKLKAES